MANERESVTPAGRELAGTVLDAFTRHRLVDIGESHGLQDHHDALQMLLTDPRLPAVARRHRCRVRQRALPGHGGPVHSRGAGRRRRSSRGLAEHHAITPADLGRAGLRALLPDGARGQPGAAGRPPDPRAARRPAIDWAAVTDGSGIGAVLAPRDAHAASVVEQQVLAKGRRALLCYGAAHLVHPGLGLRMPPSLASIIEQRTGERIACGAGDSLRPRLTAAAQPRSAWIRAWAACPGRGSGRFR